MGTEYISFRDEAREEGRREGRREGMTEAKKELAKSWYEEGLLVEEIAKLLKFTKKEVEMLLDIEPK